VENNEQLEARVRKLENQQNWYKGAATVLFTAILFVLGYEVYEIPHKVDAKVKEYIGTDVKNTIENHLSTAERDAQTVKNLAVAVAKYQPQTGTVLDGQRIPLPSGTTAEDWNVFVAPVGFSSLGSPGDDAITGFTTEALHQDDEIFMKSKVEYRDKSRSDPEALPSSGAFILIPTSELLASD